MAAPQSEADQLRQQIAFLTNLINTAHAPGSSNLRPQRNQWPSNNSQSNFGQVRSQYRHQPLIQRQPHAQSFPTTQAPAQSHTQYDARSARSTTAFSNQTNTSASADMFNRSANLNTPRSVYNQPMSTQNIPRSAYNPTSNPTQISAYNTISNPQNTARPVYNQSMLTQNSSRQAYTSNNPPQNSSRGSYDPSQSSSTNRQLPSSNVANTTSGSHVPDSVSSQGPALGQNENAYQDQRYQQQAPGYMTRSYINADVCVPGNQYQEQQQQQQQQHGQQQQQQIQQHVPNPTLTGQSSGSSLAEQSRIQPTAAQPRNTGPADLVGPRNTGPADLAGPPLQKSSPGQPADTRADQLALLMGELQKTQSKIIDLQKQLTPNSDTQGQSQGSLQQQGPPQQQGAPQQQQGPLQPQGALRQQGPPLQQQSLQQQGPALQQQQGPALQQQQGPALQLQGPALQLQRAFQLRGPGQVPRLAGPRMPGLNGNQAALLSALSAFAAQGQPLAKSERVWVNPQVNSQQVIHGRNVVGRPFTAGQGWNPLQTRPMSFFPRHPGIVAGHNLVKTFQRQVSPFGVNSGFQLKKMQSQVLATSLQMAAAQARRMQHPFGRGSQAVAAARIQSGSNSFLGAQTQVVSSKYRLQRAGNFPMAQSLVSKYKLQKNVGYGGQMGYRSGAYIGQGSRFRPHYPFVPTYGAYIQQNMWRAMHGGAFGRSTWGNYQQRGTPWVSEVTEGNKQAYSASRFWKKKQWLRWKENSRLAMKKLLQKRLLLLRRSVRSGHSKLKLDRRKKTTPGSSSVKRHTQKSDSRLVLINGMLYKSSSKNLTRARIMLEANQTAPSTSTGTQPTRPVSTGKTSVVIRKLNRTAMKTLSVRGVKFRMDSTGKSLQRIDVTSPSKGEGARPRTEVKRVDIGGVTYIQTEPGTLVRSSSSWTRAAASRVKSWSIAAATHSLRRDNTKCVNGYCVFYNKFGRCKLGTDCPYKHDPTKVAVCTRFLRGTCKVDKCPFSHKVAKEKMPVCSFFLRGMCSRDDCPYLHVKVSKDADVCQDFVRGYCPRGENCQKKHTLRCPAFAETGSCPRGKSCPMLHKKNVKKRRGNRPPTVSTLPEKTEDELLAMSENEPDSVDNTEKNPDVVPSSDGFWASSTEIPTPSEVVPDVEPNTTTVKDVSSPNGSTSVGEEKNVGEMSSAGDTAMDDTLTSDMVTGETVTGDMVTGETLAGDMMGDAVMDTSDGASSTDVSSQDTRKVPVTPEKLPTYISLADISNIEDEVMGDRTTSGQSKNPDGALQIRPRLS